MDKYIIENNDYIKINEFSNKFKIDEIINDNYFNKLENIDMKLISYLNDFDMINIMSLYII